MKIMKHSKKKIYANIILKDLNDKIISRISEAQANHYLNKGMGERIQLPDKTVIVKLNFEPKYEIGDYSDLFKISYKENKCVVCGCKEKLTKHHIIPHCYRKHISQRYLESNSHDIVPMCVYCHQNYEENVAPYRKFLNEKYNIKAELAKIDDGIVKAYRGAKVLMNFRRKLPESRKNKFKKDINKYLGRTHNYYDLEAIIDRKGKYYEEYKKVCQIVNPHYLVVQKLNDENIQEFFEGWRAHFVEYARPLHMMDYWDVQRKVQRNS